MSRHRAILIVVGAASILGLLSATSSFRAHLARSRGREEDLRVRRIMKSPKGVARVSLFAFSKQEELPEISE